MNFNPLYSIVLRSATLASVVALPLYATETDDRINATFQESYVYRTYLADDSIRLISTDGKVVLMGTVTEDSHRTLAQETAANLPGVVSVDNQLTVVGEPADKDKDKWIAKKVMVSLFFHRNVRATETKVSVLDGVVTMTGVASSDAQKALATEYAGDIVGVKSVVNNMTVAETPEPEDRTLGEKIDDASVTAQVRTALLTHRSTSNVDATVVTRDGKVTLTGVAKNAAERSLVGKLVGDIRGVTDVDNKMTVDEIETK